MPRNITANAMKGDDNKCLTAHCEDYMSKPIDRAGLLELIGKYLTSTTEPAHEESNAVT